MKKKFIFSLCVMSFFGVMVQASSPDNSQKENSRLFVIIDDEMPRSCIAAVASLRLLQGNAPLIPCQRLRSPFASPVCKIVDKEVVSPAQEEYLRRLAGYEQGLADAVRDNKPSTADWYRGRIAAIADPAN